MHWSMDCAMMQCYGGLVLTSGQEQWETIGGDDMGNQMF